MVELNRTDDLKAFAKEFGDLDFDVWTKGDETDSAILDMLSAKEVNQQAMYARIAYSFMRKSKEEISSGMEELGETGVKVIDCLEYAEEYYSNVLKIIISALARITIAAAHDIKDKGGSDD